jgi:hypothetical protein
VDNNYTISISFLTDKELTDDEISMLILQLVAQVEEPVTGEGDNVEYKTKIVTVKTEQEENK